MNETSEGPRLLEAIRCIFCDLPSDRVAIEENGFRGLRCPSCRLIYISPRPTPGQVVDLYGHDDAVVSADQHISDEHEKRLFARHTLRVLRPFKSGGKLLEIGAGAGFFLDEARKVGFQPSAIELNPIQAGFIRDRLSIPCREAPLAEGVFEPRSFDVVYHCDVLSHFHDPVAALKAMHGVLKDDGVLVFETGNFADLDPRYYRFIHRFQYPDHLFFFGRETLPRLLEATGFRERAARSYSIMPQLRVGRLLAKPGRVGRRLRNAWIRLLGRGETVDLNPPSSSQSPMYTYLMSRLRYRLGEYAPKRGRPQTVIVVAEKVASAHVGG